MTAVVASRVGRGRPSTVSLLDRINRALNSLAHTPPFSWRFCCVCDQRRGLARVLASFKKPSLDFRKRSLGRLQPRLLHPEVALSREINAQPFDSRKTG